MSPSVGLNLILIVDSKSQPEGAWSVSQPRRRVLYIHYAPKSRSFHSDYMQKYVHALSSYLFPIRTSRIAAFTRAFAFEALAPSPLSASELPLGCRFCALFLCAGFACVPWSSSCRSVNAVAGNMVRAVGGQK